MVQGEFITVEWEDLEGEIRELERVKNELEDEIDQILLQCALILEGEIKKQLKADKWEHKTADEDGEKVRDLIDTGYMREATISYVEHQMGRRYGVVSVNAEYAVHLEEGTKNDDGSQRIKAYKFAEKAYKNVEEKIIKKFEESVAELIER